MEHVQTFIVLAISLIVASFLIVTTFNLTSISNDMVQSSSHEISQLITVDNSDFASLKTTMTGLEVKELIYKYNENGLYTLTVTEAFQEGFYSSSGIEDTGSLRYVKDDSVFTGILVRNDNNVIVAVQFVEEGQSPVDYDPIAAEDNKTTIDNQIAIRQLEILDFAKQNATVCKESIQAYADWASAVQKLEAAKLDLEYRNITNTTPDTTELANSIAIFKHQESFCKSLTRTILNDWLPNKWFNPILEELSEVDLSGDDDDYWQWINGDSNDDGWEDDDQWDEDPDPPNSGNSDETVDESDPNWKPPDLSDYDDSWSDGVDFSYGYDEETDDNDDDWEDIEEDIDDDSVPIESPDGGE